MKKLIDALIIERNNYFEVSVPIGTILPFSSKDVPQNYLLCNDDELQHLTM